jgi:hypothetical protein
MTTHNLATDGCADTVRRIVRPFCSIGPAIAGDEVILDASELNHPAVAEALWTREALLETERKVDEARRAQYAGETDQATRIINDQMNAAVKERKSRKAKDAADEMQKFQDIARRAKEIAG